MKTWKQSASLGILIILAVIFIFGCNSSGNSLSGIWEEDPDYEFSATIEFNGKNFTITEYPTLKWDVLFYFSDRARTNFKSLNFSRSWENYLPFPKTTSRNSGDFDIEKLTLIETFPSEKAELVLGPNSFTIPQSYKDMAVGKEDQTYRNVSKGQYSISDNKIEFKFLDGSIEVYSFSRTENILLLDIESDEIFFIKKGADIEKLEKEFSDLWGE
jgi:hypothetical protein